MNIPKSNTVTKDRPQTNNCFPFIAQDSVTNRREKMANEIIQKFNEELHSDKQRNVRQKHNAKKRQDRWSTIIFFVKLHFSWHFTHNLSNLKFISVN